MTTNAISTNGHRLLFQRHLVIWKVTFATYVDEGLQLCLPCMFKGVSKDALNAMRAFIKHICDKWHVCLPTHDENGHQERFKFCEAISVCSRYKASNAMEVVPVNKQPGECSAAPLPSAAAVNLIYLAGDDGITSRVNWLLLFHSNSEVELPQLEKCPAQFANRVVVCSFSHSTDNWACKYVSLFGFGKCMTNVCIVCTCPVILQTF